ncbi:NUDIX domain-containing protein [Kitasatospora sp. NPDC058115]|uniref:NUDIX hydrolase n=1 Tax=Kitasatospora sp. NPDC058115 TaxID=3346347 RepID=UPI0036D8CC62
MQHRVRAVLLTPHSTLLLIKRIRPGVDPYWVIVGGRVEPTDAGPEEALVREVREEVGGEAEIVGLLHTVEGDGERQDFYLATIEKWSFEDRSGPEFSQEGRGEYLLEEIPLTTEALDPINLLPPEIATVLRAAVACPSKHPWPAKTPPPRNLRFGAAAG